MFGDRGSSAASGLSRISKDHETRLRWLETIEKGIIPFQFQHLPALRGFWPLGSVDENGDAYDLSEQDRVLSYNGNPTYNFDNLAPYIDLDGTGDFLSRADEAGLDILGTETTIASAIRGLTIGGWFYFDNAAGAIPETCISKWSPAGGAQDSYILWRDTGGAGGPGAFSIRGGASFPTATSLTIAAGGWNFMVGRFIPSTNITLFVNGISTVLAAGIPAAINNGNEGLSIGSRSTTAPLEFLDGRASFNFLCAAALSDALISSLFQQSRPLFGV